MAHPILNAPITQAFGVPNRRYSCGHHEGVDFGCPVGTPVHAVADGVVAGVGMPWGPAFGHDSILIRHNMPQGAVQVPVWVIYAHMSHENPPVGMKVLKGQVIGRSGNEGMPATPGHPATTVGPHLHLEVQRQRTWKSGGGINPGPLLAL